MRWGAFKHYYIAFSPRAQAEVAAWIRAADKRHEISRDADAARSRDH